MSGARGPDVFVRATRRLALLFTAIVVLLVAVSGVITYVTVRTDIRDVAQGSGAGETEVERGIATKSINSLRWQLIVADGLIAGAVGALGVWYASRTLRPIRDTYAAQKRFVADASHELRTPLAIMKAEFEVALREPDGGPAVSAERPAAWRETLQSGLEEVDRMSAIVDDLLLLSRIDARQEGLHPAPVDLVGLVTETVGSMAAMGRRTGVAVAVTAPAGALTATADAPHLERALRNVIKNAVEHSPPGATVDVVLAAAGGRARIEVRDEGAGIAPVDLERVFERFYRAAPSPQGGSGGGSGLGLAIARWIVEQQDGTITAGAGASGGATFVVTLPLVAH